MIAPRRASILIVDDSPTNIDLAGYVLSQGGFQVSSQPTAQDALERIKVDPPDLILMDIQLPGMDGVALTRLLKKDAATQSIIVIAFTAYAMLGDERKLLAAGCDGYLAKPIDVETFASEIQAFLDLGPQTAKGNEQDWPNSSIDSML
jgi:two-component system cell cycle response regulator DivK